MSGRERAEGEPECRRMRKLAAQFVAEQQIVERNQNDPVRQTDDADEENPRDRAAHEVLRRETQPKSVGATSRSARGISAATIAASAVSPSNQ